MDNIDLPKPSTKRLEPNIVEIGCQHSNEPTLIVALEAVPDLATYFVCLKDATDAEIEETGYLGQYDFAEGAFHIIAPEMRGL